MPIIVHKNIAYVASRSEFLDEYKKLDKREKSVMERFSKPGFDFGYSVLAMTELFEKGKKKHENDFNSRLYCFNFHNENAQDIVIELLVFFSYFYYNVKILNSDFSLQPINEYLLPFKKFYFKEQSSITISDGKLNFTISIKQIKQIKGLINNFVVFLDYNLIHFCSDVQFGTYIKIIPFKYNQDGNNYYEINDSDYIFERNKPSKLKLSKYRKKGFLVIIQ